VQEANQDLTKQTRTPSSNKSPSRRVKTLFGSTVMKIAPCIDFQPERLIAGLRELKAEYGPEIDAAGADE